MIYVEMEREVTNTVKKFVYLKAFEHLSDIEKDIKTIQESPHVSQISVLGKFSDEFNNENGIAEIEKIERQYWKNVLGMESKYCKLSSPEMGTVFISGYLVTLFLHKINGRPLGEMTTGIYGILRGLGFSKNTVDLFLKDLKTGQYLLIIRGGNNQIQEVQELL